MNHTEAHELDIVLDTAQLRSVHRLRESLRQGQEPNPLDVLVVAHYRDSVRIGRAKGPWAIVKRSGPAAGVGAGGLGIVIALINAAGSLFS